MQGTETRKQPVKWAGAQAKDRNAGGEGGCCRFEVEAEGRVGGEKTVMPLGGGGGAGPGGVEARLVLVREALPESFRLLKAPSGGSSVGLAVGFRVLLPLLTWAVLRVDY